MPTSNTTACIVSGILPHVEAAGHMALEEQQSALQAEHFLDRRYKPDDSVVTAADRKVEDFLVQRIATLHPAANIITEESEHSFDLGRVLTFAIDPIDGTDVFSQGMPGWCISVGVLDSELTPIAGIIFAPRLDLLVVASVDRSTQSPGRATLNGSPLPRPAADPISVRSNLMITSRIHKQLDLSAYIGKIRGIGSAALHLCYHLIYPPVIGALEGPGIHIWDIAAAHAINRAQGHELRYLNGDRIDYAPMVNGEPGADIVIAGCEPIVEALRGVLKRLQPDAESGD